MTRRRKVQLIPGFMMWLRVSAATWSCREGSSHPCMHRCGTAMHPSSLAIHEQITRKTAPHMLYWESHNLQAGACN